MVKISMQNKIIILLFVTLVKYSGAIRQLLLYNGTEDLYRCLNDRYIERHQLCNGFNDCMDNSDEKYCSNYNRACPDKYPFFRCNDYTCIPLYWKCDGIRDCRNGDDELDCNDLINIKRQAVSYARRNATRWLYKQAKNNSYATDTWGMELKKISVALHLGDPKGLTFTKIRREMAYELTIQLLSKFAFRKLKSVSTADLATYINALMVTCLDPRKFHSANLVEELRSRADAQNYTNPYVFLTLCNAGEQITHRDVEKLNQTFWNAHTEFWTETQAIAVMGLACAGQQQVSNFDMKNIKDLTFELKKRQYRNGTVEDLKTTALVMQALFAAESEEDSNNFDEEKALTQILREQQKDGSFGDIMNTYYVLPILCYRTLVNISSNHCKPYVKDEESGRESLTNYAGPKMYVRYSLWIGNDKDVERTLKLRVPSNISFYGIMELSGDIDSKFRFQYVVKNTKPYAKAISGIQDDPETGRFWFLYSVQESKPTPVLKSPADLFPKNNDHVIMWYRTGTWIE